MGFRGKMIKLVVKVRDVFDLLKRFETSPAMAMRELGGHMRQGAKEVLERVMEAEIELFLGQDAVGLARSHFKRPGSVVLIAPNLSR